MAPPSLALSLAEGIRSVADAAALPFAWPMLWSAPSGDGHPVMVLPGFLGSSGSTAIVRRFIESKGYAVFDWGLGRNLGPVATGATGYRLLEQVLRVHQDTDRKVSLVGWSLGGVMAREIAKLRPDVVRQVITLGSPFNDGPSASYVWELYKLVTGDSGRVDEDFIKSLSAPPPVPSTSVYSRTDGVVNWRACIEQEADTTDNIEVVAAHCGLGFNSHVYTVIARKLSMPEDGWRKL